MKRGKTLIIKLKTPLTVVGPTVAVQAQSKGVPSAIQRPAGDTPNAPIDQCVKAGNFTIFPPAMADSWAHRPTQVQLADWTALGKGWRFEASAEANS
jgi:hypothetical protein